CSARADALLAQPGQEVGHQGGARRGRAVVRRVADDADLGWVLLPGEEGGSAGVARAAGVAGRLGLEAVLGALDPRDPGGNATQAAGVTTLPTGEAEAQKGDPLLPVWLPVGEPDDRVAGRDVPFEAQKADVVGGVRRLPIERMRDV